MAKKTAKKKGAGRGTQKALKPRSARGKTAKAAPKKATLAGKRIAFTGKLERFSRDEAEAQARSLGAIAVSTVNAETDLVVAGPRAGSKLAAAKKHGVNVIDEVGWIALTGPGPGLAAPAAALGKPEIKKIQAMLKSKTAEGITLGLSLLESLGATQADYEAAFTETVIKSILGGWVAESWGAVAKALVPHGAVSDVFQKLAKEKYLKRPRRLADFSGLIHARPPVARVAFLAAWGQGSALKKPFLDLVDIPAGSFTMGSPENEADRSDNENQVQVRITKPFRMGRTVVTQRQWRAVMGTEPWRYEGLKRNQCGDDFPAVYVSWDDAVLFCEKLTDLEREMGRLAATQSYRLPTEAEWEYACRAGTTTAYSFGDDPNLLNEHGWYEDNSGSRLHAVAEKKPNPWGLFDMHGNVWEWCADWYDDTLAGGDDPVGPSAGSRRVYRGGYWCDDASGCRSAYRDYDVPGPLRHRGFRVVVLC